MHAERTHEGRRIEDRWRTEDGRRQTEDGERMDGRRRTEDGRRRTERGWTDDGGRRTEEDGQRIDDSKQTRVRIILSPVHVYHTFKCGNMGNGAALAVKPTSRHGRSPTWPTSRHGRSPHAVDHALHAHATGVSGREAQAVGGVHPEAVKHKLHLVRALCLHRP
eukprot:365826-Chlamydomonas_euryale.AAC.13